MYLLISIFLLLTLVTNFTPSSTDIPSPSTIPVPVPSLEEEWLPDGMIKAGEYSGTASYDEYTISWRSDEKYIYAGMTAKTNGWISLDLPPKN